MARPAHDERASDLVLGVTRTWWTQRIVIMYLALAAAWIAVTDLIAGHLPLWVATFKGLLFVAVTAALLASLVTRRARELDRRGELLRREAAKSEMLFEMSPKPMCVFDTETRSFLEVNEAAVAMYGYTREEFSSMKLVDLEAPDDGEPGTAIRAARQVGSTHYSLVRHRRKDGELLTLTVISRPIDFRGRAARLAVVRDETDRVRVQQARRDLLGRLASAEEATRRRISESIHDGPVQHLTAVSLRLQMVRRHLTDADLLARLTSVSDDVNRSIDELRVFMVDMRLPDLERVGLARALRLYGERTGGHGLPTVVVADETGATPPIAVTEVAYRISAEAISNARRHASARNIEVVFRTADAVLEGEIRDDGVGVEPEVLAHSDPAHLGVTTMRERAEAAGGWCRITGTPDVGTTVVFGLPFAPSDIVI